MNCPAFICFHRLQFSSQKYLDPVSLMHAQCPKFYNLIRLAPFFCNIFLLKCTFALHIVTVPTCKRSNKWTENYIMWVCSWILIPGPVGSIWFQKRLFRLHRSSILGGFGGKMRSKFIPYFFCQQNPLHH